MPDPARPLKSEHDRKKIRQQLQVIVEQHLPPDQDVDVKTERHAIIRDMDPIFRMEAAAVLLDEAVHNLLLEAIHRRRSVFENRVTKGAKKFQEAKAAWLNGDSDAIGAFAQKFRISSGEQRPVGKMTRPDLLHVAGDREKRAAKEALRGAFFRSLAARLPDDTTLVEDVMDEAEFADLYREQFVGAGSTGTK